MIFKTLKSMDGRLKALENRSWLFNCYATVGGVFGGALAALAVKWGLR